jgi:hypothetical protein
MIVVQFGNLGFPVLQNLGFSVGTKLGVSNGISCDERMSLRRDLEITDFVDVVEDGNNLRWGRM